MNDRISRIKNCFKNEYFLRLAIIDHINEISFIYNNEFKKNKSPISFYKELTDLKILLDIIFDNDVCLQDLKDKRIDKFIEKINNEIIKE